MAKRYFVNAESLSQSQFEKLRQDLNDFTFLAAIIANVPQSLDVITYDGETLESLIADFPELSKCHIVQSS